MDLYSLIYIFNKITPINNGISKRNNGELLLAILSITKQSIFNPISFEM